MPADGGRRQTRLSRNVLALDQVDSAQLDYLTLRRPPVSATRFVGTSLWTRCFAPTGSSMRSRPSGALPPSCAISVGIPIGRLGRSQGGAVTVQVFTVRSRYAAEAPNNRFGAQAASIGANMPALPMAPKTLMTIQ